MNSNNFFQLVAEFQKQIDFLNKILIGDDNDSVSIDGVLKPSITKELSDRFKELQNYVHGRLAYETKAKLDIVTPPQDVFLAEVWRDSDVDNNGLYGWTGSAWEKSKYDWLNHLLPKIKENADYSAGILPDVGISKRESTPEQDTDIPFVVDKNGRAAIAFKKDSGRLIADLQQLYDMSVENFPDHTEVSLIPLVIDKNGRAALSFERDTGKVIAELDQQSSNLVGEKIGFSPIDLPPAIDTAFAITDKTGRVGLRIGMDGQVHFLGSSTVDTKVRHYFVRGQSLSMGYKSQPALTTENVINALSFGYPPNNPEFSTLYKMAEFDSGVYGETPASGAAGHYRRHESGKYSGADLSEGYPAALISIHSVSGVNIESLSKGTNIYETTQSGASAAKALVNGMNLNYEVGAVLWVQGEANERDRTEPEKYAELLEKLIEDHNQDMREALNDLNITMPLITYQTNHRYHYTTPLTALGQLLAANRHELVFMSSPIYQYDVVDHTHLTNYCSRRLGEKMMQAALAVEKEGDWQPLRPIMVKKTGEKEITAEFLVRYPPLDFDTTEVVDPGNYGFEVLNSSDAKQPIESVELGIGNTVIIKTTNVIQSGDSLGYAYHNEPGASSGRKTGARGNLRDNDPAMSVYQDANGNAFHQYNYCVTFKEAIK